MLPGPWQDSHPCSVAGVPLISVSLCGLAKMACIFSPEWHRRQDSEPSFVKLGVRPGFFKVSCAAETTGLLLKSVNIKMVNMSVFTILCACVF